MPALAFIAHRLFDQISAIIGHSGYEYFAGPTSRKPFPGICTTYHDQHHSEFVYNYANYFSWWDRIFGTIHPHYDRIIKGWEDTGARPHMPKAKEQI
jgi:sterol desaturase/sphingolipid hydroxylase (fatty acid hydroxylase superfamily)